MMDGNYKEPRIIQGSQNSRCIFQIMLRTLFKILIMTLGKYLLFVHRITTRQVQ